MIPIPATANPISVPTYTDKAQRHNDGSVLLSIADDRICKLNGVGALTWIILEEHPEGLSANELALELSEQFEAINSEGELRYEVSLEQLREDTARFVRNMAQMHLLDALTDVHGQEFYCIRAGVSGTTSASTATAKTDAGPIGAMAFESAGNDVKLSKRETFTAFIALTAFDLLLRFAGFQALVKKVERYPTVEPRTTSREICRHVRAMVDRAQMYYPKKAMCLQHSAVVTYLLRRRGVPAEMVLAACDFLPEAHAWVEVKGEVVNDSAAVKGNYRELYRA